MSSVFKMWLPAMIALTLGCASSEPIETGDQPRDPANDNVARMVVQSTEADHNTDAHAKSSDAHPRIQAVEDKESAASDEQSQPMPTLDEWLLFFPSKFPDGNWQPSNLEFEDVWFTTDDDVRIHGWFCPCDQPRAILLYAHGNAGNISHRASLVAYLQQQLNVAVLAFDYRGYGRSEGVPSTDGILRDARAARAFLANHAGVDESDVVLMGRSLGGAVAVELAAELPPRGMILESTFSSMKDVALVHYPRLAWLVPRGKLNANSLIGRYEGPLLQSHGDADRTIPYSLGQKLFESANEPKQFVTITDGDHNDPQTPEFYRQLDQFIGSLK